jgi:hypothetical protein
LDLVDINIGLSDAGAVGTGTTTVYLYSNDPAIGGPQPGALLATIGSIGDSSLSSTYEDYDFPVSSPIPLSPSTRYWIVLSSTSASTAQWTYTASTGGIGVASEYFNNSSGTTANTEGPYKLEVTAVPEPSSMALLGLGLFAGGSLFRRKPSVS